MSNEIAGQLLDWLKTNAFNQNGPTIVAAAGVVVAVVVVVVVVVAVAAVVVVVLVLVVDTAAVVAVGALHFLCMILGMRATCSNRRVGAGIPHLKAEICHEMSRG